MLLLIVLAWFLTRFIIYIPALRHAILLAPRRRNLLNFRVVTERVPLLGVKVHLLVALFEIKFGKGT